MNLKSLKETKNFEECPINNPTDYTLLTLLSRYAGPEALKIYQLCGYLNTLQIEAIKQLENYPALNPSSFKLILNRFRVKEAGLQGRFRSIYKSRQSQGHFEIGSILTLNDLNTYEVFQKYKRSTLAKKESSYLRELVELAFAIKTQNYLRVENILEVLINYDVQRLTFELEFDREGQELLAKIVEQIDVEKINQRKLNMFKAQTYLLFNKEEVEDVFDSVQELRLQLKSFYGRNFPLYYLRKIKLQISQKEHADYALQVLSLAEEGKVFPLEVYVELLKVLPRNKTLMRLIVKEFEAFPAVNDYKNFVLLELSENEIFRRYLVDSLKEIPKAKFQLDRKIYLQLLSNKKTTLFALSHLWEMGDKEISNVWLSAILLNQ